MPTRDRIIMMKRAAPKSGRCHVNIPRIQQSQGTGSHILKLAKKSCQLYKNLVIWG